MLWWRANASHGAYVKSIIQCCVYIGDGVTVMNIEPHAEIMAAEAGVEVVRL